MDKRELNDEDIEKFTIGSLVNGEVVEKKRGTYGVVYIIDQGKGVYPRYVAYKTTDDEYDERRLDAFDREAKVWFKVRGYPLILTPFLIKHFNNRPLICMPFCEKDLRTYLDEKKKLSSVEALVIASQILKGLIFARKRGIEAHQDLKPENVLLEDLSKKFVGWPPQNADESIKWRVRVADFGSANAWRELNKPSGTKPYMAPEQWEMKVLYDKKMPYKEKVDFSKVDVFAVGIILYELLTGRHPVGVRTSDVWPKPREGFSKRWEKGDNFKKWTMSPDKNIKIENCELSEELEDLIRSMLELDLEKRITLEKSFEKVMGVLSKLHKPTAEQLKLLYDYYDTLAGFKENIDRLDSLIQLAQIPRLKDEIINELLNEISDTEKCIDTPGTAVYFCELCYKTSKLLINRGRENDKERVKEFAEKILSTATAWRSEIKAHHKYPTIKFKNKVLIETRYKDFEIYAELIGYARKLLEIVEGERKTREIFEDMDNLTKSAYFYSIAAKYHSQGDERKAVDMLDECIKLNPNEAVFYFMKALWLERHLLKMKIYGEPEEKEKRLLEENMIKSIRKALKIDPNWEEARKFYENISRYKH